eukprot:4023738-Pyramimonas_sp.AAC.1
MVPSGVTIGPVPRQQRRSGGALRVRSARSLMYARCGTLGGEAGQGGLAQRLLCNMLTSGCGEGGRATDAC